jgi:ATP-dependent Clp protease ATP-binding subunit ClpC
MPQIDIKLHILLQQFEDDNPCQLGEALFFPDVSCLDHVTDEVKNLVAENVLSLLSHVPNANLSQCILAGDVEPMRVDVQVEPAEPNRIWREPVSFKLPAVKWQQAQDMAVVYIPSLGIEVLANKADDLPKLIEDQVRMTLYREKTTRSLKALCWQSRCQDVSVHTTTIEHFVIPPKQQIQDERKPDPNEGKDLEKVSDIVLGLTDVQAWYRDDQVRQLADILGGRMARSVLLVGPSGVGKTAVLKEMIRRSSDLGLSGCKFRATSGSRMVSGMTGFGMWQERCEAIRKQMVRDNIILHVGSLMELMEVGRSECQTQGMASYLRPSIARGEILIVAECTPEQLSLIERQDVALLRAFVQLQIDEPPQPDRVRILTQVARTAWSSTSQLFSPEAIDEIERLHRRFATYSAFPARPIRFLQNLRRDISANRKGEHWVDGSITGLPLESDTSAAEPKRPMDVTISDAPVISAQDVAAAFSRETGLPMWMLDDRVRLDLEAAECWFSSRVIGQPESVTLIINLLATLKAQLNREHRPLASFLFIGPTGVGKTEMAKTLAEYMFGAAGSADSRMIRIDMSEYADPSAVQRLIGGSATSEGVLTARVREQPFAVVLLDEFEKAHDSLFDLLLQVLGEGRLTDAAGRVADFRNCIIIMTSNLGASTFARGSVGFGMTQADVAMARDHFEKAVRGFLRPEMFNRIDRIVPFAPLDQETARKVVKRQLELIRQRDGLKYRRVTLTVGEDVVDYLLEHGFEPRYGARSLKRVMERDMLAPLSERFNQYAAETVLTAECRVEEATLRESDGKQRRLVHTVKAQSDAAGRVMTSLGADANQLELVTQLQHLRSRVQKLKISPIMLSLENKVFRLERTERRWNKNPKQSPHMMQLRHELDQQRTWVSAYDQFLQSIVEKEDGALMALYATDAPPLESAMALRTFIARSGEQLTEHLLDLMDLQTEDPHRVRMLLVSDDAAAMQQLAQAYYRITQALDVSCRLWQFVSSGTKRTVLLEEQWTLETLMWKEIPPPPKSTEPSTWQLIDKAEAEKSDPISILLRREVQEPKKFLSESLDGVFGLFLDLKGERIFNRLAREDGVHRFHFANRKPDVHVFTGLPAIDSYLPPFGIERRGAVVLTERCRDYDYVRKRMTDEFLSEYTELLEGNLSQDLGPLLARRHVKIAERMIG